MTVVSDIKNRKPTPAGGADSRCFLVFHFSLAASRGCVKGSVGLIGGVGVAVFPPGRAVLDDPVGQRLFKADVAAGLFRLDPLVLEDFLALRLEFAIQRRVLQQIVGRR